MATPKRAASNSPLDDEEGPSPKRQRRSYSPDSPSLPSETKASATSPQPPQTPPPSVHMSPEAQAQQLPGLGLLGAAGSNAGSTAGSVTFPTPPSTAGLHSQIMARGASSEGISDSDGQAPRATIQIDSTDARDVPMAGTDESDAEHRRSDHERQDTVSALPSANVLYKLHTSFPPSAPHPSQDLISLYSLNRLQASVARRDPVTGAKINKLRKSYEGKVKELGLEGRNKASKTEGILDGLVDPGWDVPLADGRIAWDGGMFADPPLLGADEGASAIGKIEALLGTALDLRPGHLPAGEHNGWKNLLGLDDATLMNPTKLAASPQSATASGPLGVPRTAASNLLSKTTPSGALRNSAPSSPHAHLSSASRPDRAGKKRRYDESSYAGYQEGYDDDGYSTGGMDDSTGGRRGSGGGAKRQKMRKDFPPSASASTSPPFATNPSANNGMVGVRSS
ncbi:Rox3 mediator complex subunit-domain-containing protein [Neohortaea acidophila]|uniref:Mediator of RNA polymerase II transcription subunit 19 n=1 Tax=Neohortaea acidophila TaxID=245834 RepID=A0A6A6PWE8_9PEZI|nr:Rox3 mediator complex subunit-domain-containing protein [Neohortaea acidophila]KAF2484315.1 Rox3 mediator complex subunit-domain-containing protein [Neohortaea acidophila]